MPPLRRNIHPVTISLKKNLNALFSNRSSLHPTANRVTNTTGAVLHIVRSKSVIKPDLDFILRCIQDVNVGEVAGKLAIVQPIANYEDIGNPKTDPVELHIQPGRFMLV